MSKKNRNAATALDALQDDGAEFVIDPTLKPEPGEATGTIDIAVIPHPLVISDVTLSLPVAELGTGYRLRWLDLRLSGEQPQTFRRLLDGLVNSGATMTNGRKVTRAEHVFYYILDALEKSS